MFYTLLTTLWLGFTLTPLHQWEVNTLGDDEEVQIPKRVEVTKERDSVLCSNVDDRFVIPPSYRILERVKLLERSCIQHEEEQQLFASKHDANDVSEETNTVNGEREQADGQNEQVTQAITVEQPKAEVKSSTPQPTPVEKPVVQEEPKPQPKQQEQVQVQPKVQPQEVKKEEPKQSNTTVVGNFNTSHYTASCNGCSGITASGYDVRNTIYSPEGYRIVAADPSVLPLGTVIQITYSNGTSFKAKVMDKGGAIKGYKLDVLVSSKEEAYRLGRVTTKVEIVR